MRPGIRKLVLAVHLVLSLGWIGAILAYVAADAVATSDDAVVAAAGWMVMATIGWNVLVPLAVGSLLSGIAIAMGTPWGLLRHYWVVFSLVLTVFAAAVLVAHMPSVSATAQALASGASHAPDARHAGAATGGGSRGDLLHAVGGLGVLLVVAVLNVYKPRGLTPYGWRRQHERGAGAEARR